LNAYACRKVLGVKYSIPFGAVTVLGIIFVAIFFATIAVSSKPLDIYPPDFLNNAKMWFLLTVGTFCLTAGVVGIVRHHFESQRSLFAALIAISMPILVIAVFYLGYVLPSPTY
jgi:hypothetical protein